MNGNLSKNFMGKIKKFVYDIFTNRTRFRIFIFTIFALVFLSFSLVFFIMSLGKPYLGMSLTLKGEEWVVESVDSFGLARNAGIGNGDKPVTIDGIPADRFLEKYWSNGVVYATFFSSITVSDAEGRQTSVALQDSSLIWQAVAEQLEWIFVSFAFWITGFYVFYKRPYNLAALLYCFCGLAVGLILSGNMASTIGIPWALQVHIGASIFSPWLLLHFFYILPKERKRLQVSARINIIYLIPVITVILFPVIGYTNGQPVGWFRTLRFIEYGAGLSAVLMIAFINYRYVATSRTRQQMKIILLSCLVALLPLIVMTIFPSMITNGHSTEYSIPFLVFIPVGFTYAVVTRNLLEINVIVRRGVVYSLVTMIMAAVLSVGIFVVLKFQSEVRVGEQIIIAIIIALAAYVLFGPVKKGIENLVDRLFYRDRYDHRTVIKTLSTSLNSLNRFNEISQVIINTIMQTLNIAGSCLLIYKGDSLEASTAQGTFSGKSCQKKLALLISQNSDYPGFPESASGLAPNLAFIVPLTAAGKEIGVLCLSQKISKQDYTADDIYLIHGVISVSSIALRSAVLMRDVSEQNAFMSMITDELHMPISNIIGYSDFLIRRDPPKETRQQWLKNIMENGRQVIATVDNLVDLTHIQMNNTDMKIKSIRISDVLVAELALIRETTDIHQFVENIEANLPVSFIDRDKFSRVIGYLLANAVKYSPGGGRITVSAYFDTARQRNIISVADEGMGISAADKASIFMPFSVIKRPRTKNVGGSGLSLYITQKWIEAMGGKIWLESEINRGSTFFIALPVKVSGVQN